MDAKDLDYLEKRGLDISLAHERLSSDEPRPKPPAYHSQLGSDVCGFSAYGLILLAFLAFTSLLTYGLIHGFWHLCVHYSASKDAHPRPHLHH